MDLTSNNDKADVVDNQNDWDNDGNDGNDGNNSDNENIAETNMVVYEEEGHACI